MYDPDPIAPIQPEAGPPPVQHAASTATEPPPVQEPGPQAPPPPGGQPPPRESAFQRKLKTLGPVGVFLATVLAKLKGLWSILYLVFKFAKIGKIALTLGTMLLSIVLYSRIFGWSFGAGFAVLIFVHEMGHIFVGWKQKLPMSAPIFIPFCGAVIFNKRGSPTAWGQAIMGIGGPVAGSLGSLACLAIYGLTGNLLFLALAFFGFFMNLFNLMPIVPLDGGWIVGAVSPWLWLVGLVGLVVMTFTGHMTNPMVWILVILSLPRGWSLFRPGRAQGPGQVRGILIPPTMPQRLIMGFCYFALAGALMLGTEVSHSILQAHLHPAPPPEAKPSQPPRLAPVAESNAGSARA